jgi:ubiquinone/menaquinone biosynthesis C-methylase UbiE
VATQRDHPLIEQLRQEDVATWDELAQRYGGGAFAQRTAEMAAELVERAQLARGERVLDLGTGTGLALLPAAQAVGPEGAVTGVDFSSGMLAAAAVRVRAAGAGNVELLKRDVRALGVFAASFDVVLAGSVMQFVGFDLALLRAWRGVLRPGGRLVFSVPARTEVTDVLDELMREFGARLPWRMRCLLAAAGEPAPPPGDLATWCREGGFSAAACCRLRRRELVGSFEQWWAAQSTHGAWGMLRHLDADARADMRDAAHARMRHMLLASGELPLVWAVDYCVATC